ncbi:MAG: glycosyltransferase family 39 protein [Planctomycetes bacterium]|nr:glycosyltransferase family 39 protein [Planctomycetota bacterium]
MKKEHEDDASLAQGRHRGILSKAAVPLAIVFAVLLLDLLYVSRPGWVWDETYYFEFSTATAKWLAHPTLDEAVINATFREGNAHPPLPIYQMALTGALLQGERGDFLLAVRLATAAQFAALAVIVYLFVKREAGRTAALFATVLTVLSPRLFAHSLLATYDVPLCLVWVAATMAFYKGMTSRPWAILSGVIFGLALLTKVNAFLLPLAFWPWAIYFYRRKSLPAILSMCVLGPMVFFAGWPWLWLHPVENFAEYIVDKFPAGALPAFVYSLTGTANIPWREAASTLYFGKVAAGGVPWHYPFVMLVVTMPLATLAGAVYSGIAARREPAKKGLLVLLWWSVFVQLAVFAFGIKPYDGVRLFLPVLVLVAIAAGMGLSRLAARGSAIAIAVVALVAISPGVEFFVYEPYGMSYFTPAVGGLPGAEALGMEVTYYGEAVDQAGLDAINRRGVKGQRVAYAPMFKKLPWRMPVEYVKYGFLKLGLEPCAPWNDWDYLVFVNRGGCIDETDRANLAKGEVIHENRLLGVMLSETLARKPRKEGTNAPGHN